MFKFNVSDFDIPLIEDALSLKCSMLEHDIAEGLKNNDDVYILRKQLDRYQGLSMRFTNEYNNSRAEV